MSKQLNRRSFLRQVIGGVALPGSALALTGCATIPYTDTDPNDPAGQGRGSPGFTGYTDRDPTDPVRHGRGPAGARVPRGDTTGTGFYISRDGYIITSYHVLQGADRVEIARGGEYVAAEIVAQDQGNDIAILRCPGETTPLPLTNARNARVGQEVFSMGFPLSTVQGNELRANFGHINALSGIGGDNRFLQVDVPLQPGNSGGPLLGPDGTVIGVVAGRLNDLAILAATGAIPQNISYAVRIDYALPLIPTTVTLVTAALTGNMEQRVETGRQAVVQIVARRGPASARPAAAAAQSPSPPVANAPAPTPATPPPPSPPAPAAPAAAPSSDTPAK